MTETKCEIVVTDEMIRAGLRAVDPMDWSILVGDADFYRAIFLAMADAALREGLLRLPSSTPDR